MQYQTAWGEEDIHSTSAVSLQKRIRRQAEGFAILNFFPVSDMPPVCTPFSSPSSPMLFAPSFLDLHPFRFPFNILHHVRLQPATSTLPFPTMLLTVSGNAMPINSRTAAPKMTKLQNTHSNSALSSQYTSSVHVISIRHHDTSS